MSGIKMVEKRLDAKQSVIQSLFKIQAELCPIFKWHLNTRLVFERKIQKGYFCKVNTR